MGIDSYSILSSWLLHAVKNIHEKMKIKNAIQVISLFIVDNLKFSGGGRLFNGINKHKTRLLIVKNIISYIVIFRK